MLRILLVFWLIVSCLRKRVNPAWFFQLNAGYFNGEKGYYSKQELNHLIPPEWQLKQEELCAASRVEKFPVFLKPEWGQNSHGIYRVDHPDDFLRLGKILSESKIPYLLQEAANELREFEIFYIRDTIRPDKFTTMTITEVKNKSAEKLPINGVLNSDSVYIDKTTEFTREELQQIWKLIDRLGNFWISRIGLKSDSEKDMLSGNFHIVEINLFTPMPLNLLDTTILFKKKHAFIRNSMDYLAQCCRLASLRDSRESIFFRKLKMHQQVKTSPKLPANEPSPLLSFTSKPQRKSGEMISLFRDLLYLVSPMRNKNHS